MDLLSMLRTLGALGLVLGMLAGALWAVRRYDLKLPGRVSGSGRRRVELIERLAVDAKRSVALIRRDGCEHLVLIGPEGHVTLETGIAAPAAPAPEAAPALPAKVEDDLAALKSGLGRLAEKIDFRTMVDRFRPEPLSPAGEGAASKRELPPSADLRTPSCAQGGGSVACEGEIRAMSVPAGRGGMQAMPFALVAANDAEPLPARQPRAEAKRTRAPRNTTRWNKRAVREALDA